ncbi:MAG: hypothetical protein IJQ85_09755 [Selenomonadaceae bacterium]|nr:hypothetical protein [Selenomonadaceae bacterium]
MLETIAGLFFLIVVFIFIAVKIFGSSAEYVDENNYYYRNRNDRNDNDNDDDRGENYD